jgi:hypothetical protein
MIRYIALVSILAILFPGCGKPAANPASAQPAPRVLATVNGEPISDKDLKLSLAIRLMDDPDFKVTPSTKNEQIQMIIDERLELQRKDRASSDIKIF